MTSGSPTINEVPEKPTCSHCNSTKLLIIVLFVLYAVCQVQILLNRQRSVDAENILRGFQKASERIADMELSLAKVEGSLDVLQDECFTKTTTQRRTKRQSVPSIRKEIRRIKRNLKHLERRYGISFCNLGSISGKLQLSSV